MAEVDDAQAHQLRVDLELEINRSRLKAGIAVLDDVAAGLIQGKPQRETIVRMQPALVGSSLEEVAEGRKVLCVGEGGGVEGALHAASYEGSYSSLFQCIARGVSFSAKPESRIRAFVTVLP